MRAWIIDRFEGIGNLRLTDVADPQPAAGEVLLRLACASLHPADRYLAQREYPATPLLPHVLGRDGCGEIVAAGKATQGHPPGAKRAILRGVVGISRWGTFAELVTAPVESLIDVPAGWSDEQACSAPQVYVTAYQALTQWEDLPHPAVVLISGASGGVGSAAVQLGAAMGHCVIALSRDPQKRATLRTLGAALALDPADAHWHSSLSSFLQKSRVDLVIDNVGGSLLPQLIATLGDRGRVSVVGRVAGEVPQFNSASLLFRRLRLGGVAVGAYTNKQSRDAWNTALDLLGRRRAHPLVDSIFPFEQLPAAFQKLSCGPMGKVLVRCGN